MKIIQESGKRKKAVARATLRDGIGKIKINKVPIDFYEPKLYRLKIREVLMLAGDIVGKVDIDINVNGGGMSSQADAAKLAIAKSLVAYSKSEKLREQFLKYDRNLLVADVRRKEPAKPNRHGQARAKRQKSYR